MKLFWDNAESKSSALSIPEHKYMMMTIKVIMMMTVKMLLLVMMKMKMTITMAITMMMMTTMLGEAIL